MVPGEYMFDGPDIEINAGREAITLKVKNTGDRPCQVGSHFHFYEANAALVFDREQAYGRRLDLLSGTAIRFEPGDEKEVKLIPLAGQRIVYGFNGLVNGPLDDPSVQHRALQAMQDGKYGNQKAK